MLRGTRVLVGEEARQHRQTIAVLRTLIEAHGFEEVSFPSVWEQAPFIERAGPEIVNQLYAWNDKKGRPICLIPEVTALVQQTWKESWSQEKPKPYRVFYVQRCYRYERPQAGRYREFTQLGVEILGGAAPADALELHQLLAACLHSLPLAAYSYSPSVKRGLAYYVEDGFEVEVPSLGAQKQVCGGGRYDCGIGFAFGIERLVLAQRR